MRAWSLSFGFLLSEIFTRTFPMISENFEERKVEKSGNFFRHFFVFSDLNFISSETLLPHNKLNSPSCLQFLHKLNYQTVSHRIIILNFPQAFLKYFSSFQQFSRFSWHKHIISSFSIRFIFCIVIIRWNNKWNRLFPIEFH